MAYAYRYRGWHGLWTKASDRRKGLTIVHMTQARGATRDRAATAIAKSSMLSLLDEPFTFTQHRALTVERFGDELRCRKIIWPEPGQLAAFHRLDLLVPIYSIVYDPAVVRARARADGRRFSRDDIRAILDYTSTYGQELVAERQVGDLLDPAEVGYTPWRSQLRRFAARPYRTRQYLYSYHQLLASPFGHASVVKILLDEMGLVGGPVRPPLPAITDEARDQVRIAAVEVGIR